MKHPELGASLLSAHPFEIKDNAHELADGKIDFFHIDVMDGNFVPNLALNSSICKALCADYPSIPLDVHFMTTRKALDAIMPSFLETRPKWITFHVELKDDLKVLLDQCLSNGVAPGLAINPDTPLEVLIPFLPYCHIVLLMSVSPGYGGQAFREDTFKRLEALTQWRKDDDKSFLIEVDGGISLPIAQKLVELGADMMVIGSQLIFQQDKKAFIAKFHQMK